MDSIDTFFICQVFVKMMKWTLKYYFWIFMPREFNACLAIKQVDKQKIVKKINEQTSAVCHWFRNILLAAMLSH